MFPVQASPSCRGSRSGRGPVEGAGVAVNRSAGVALLALSLAACAGGGAAGGRPQGISITPPTSATSPAHARAKYTALPTCRQVTQRVPGLPPFRSGNEDPSVSDMLTGCEFQRIPDWPRVNLQVSAWRDEKSDISGPAGPGRGALKAREVYDVTSKPGADPADDGAAEDVEVGEEAGRLALALLHSLLADPPPRVSLSTYAEGRVAEGLELTRQGQFEGIVIKRPESTYVSGRSDEWLKLKHVDTQELACVGYMRSAGMASGAQVLLLAEPSVEGWSYAGRVKALSDAHSREAARL